MDHQNVLRQGI